MLQLLFDSGESVINFKYFANEQVKLSVEFSLETTHTPVECNEIPHIYKYSD